MAKNLKRMRKYLAKNESISEAEKYDFPLTYVLLKSTASSEAFKKHAGSTWIMKPIGKAQERNISLTSSHISDWRKDHNWKKDAPRQRRMSRNATSTAVPNWRQEV